MSNYINKVLDKDQNEYPLHDARIVATPEDVGKLLSIDESGQLVFIEPPAGGTKLYAHAVAFSGKPIAFATTYSTPLSLYTTYGAANSAFWFNSDYGDVKRDIILVNSFVNDAIFDNVGGTMYYQLKLTTMQSGPSTVLAISGCTTSGDENTRVIVPYTSLTDTVTEL